MNIFNHFQHINLTNDQYQSLESIQDFLVSENNIFILKGYAGTGKTTLIAGLVKYLEEKNTVFQVMAPTGRASKILRSKTGYGATIHRSIYKLENIHFSSENTDKDTLENDETYKLNYPIKKLEQANSVLIVDESSLISSQKSEHPIFSFGSDILLKDLISYAQAETLNTKIIFVGDPAQLAPVGDSKSWAFEPSLFRSKGLSVVEAELKEVKRQSKNLIFENAFKIRDNIFETNATELILDYDNDSYIKLNPENIIDKYIEESSTPEFNSSIIIAYSNKQCFFYNKEIRNQYFPGREEISSGDIIQIINNSYNLYPTEVFNGDFAKVVEVSPSIEKLSAPIYIEENGKKRKETLTLLFRKLVILLDNFDTPFECMIIDSLLNSPNRDLTYIEMKALYINFLMRWDAEQKNRENIGLPKQKRYGDIFKERLLKDPYLNALRCKYGYAITCHKAQGGEWQKTFVDYTGRVSLKQEPLRWSYTATTRAISTCFAINPPHFSSFSKFKINEIGHLANIPNEAFVFDNIPTSPFHQEGQHLCKSLKYWEVLEQLEDTEFEIKSVLSKDYLERYTVEYNELLVQIEGYHNKAGIFTNGFKVINDVLDEDLKLKLENIFNQTPKINYRLQYAPSKKVLAEIYAIIQDVCSQLDIPITNVVENIQQNYVRYYFQTNSLSANIQFYYNNKEQITAAFPKSYKCDSDEKLENLIQKLRDYVI